MTRTIIQRMFQICKTTALVLCALLCLHPFSVFADISQDDLNSINNGTPWFSFADMQSCSNNGAINVGSPIGNAQFGIPTLPPGDVPTQMMTFLTSQGLSQIQAAGIMGNLKQESSLNPKSVQAGGPGRGIAQWSVGGRWDTDGKDNLVNYFIPAHGPGTDPFTLAPQLGFLWYELNTYYASTLKNLRAATTIADAVNAFVGPDDVNGHPVPPTAEVARSGGFEDPGTPNMANRIKYANELLGGGGSGSGTGTTTGAPGQCSGSITGNGTCSVNSPIYIDQYSQAQLKQIFRDPGTADSHPDLHLTKATFLGFTAQVSPLVAPCLEAVSQELQSQGVTYKVTQFGCYRFDSNNGTSNIGLKSYHTYGAACDINWDTNPFVESGAPTAHDMPDQFVKAFHDHGFTWGGSWTQPKDYMHFEWHGIVPPGAAKNA